MNDTNRTWVIGKLLKGTIIREYDYRMIWDIIVIQVFIDAFSSPMDHFFDYKTKKYPFYLVQCRLSLKNETQNLQIQKMYAIDLIVRFFKKCCFAIGT